MSKEESRMNEGMKRMVIYRSPFGNATTYRMFPALNDMWTGDLFTTEDIEFAVSNALEAGYEIEIITEKKTENDNTYLPLFDEDKKTVHAAIAKHNKTPGYANPIDNLTPPEERAKEQ